MTKPKSAFPAGPALGVNLEAHQTWLQYGSRLVQIRGEASQAAFAPKMGVHKNTLGHYERGTREVGADALRSLVYLGWNANWVLTGEGPETLDRVGDLHGRMQGYVDAAEMGCDFPAD